MIKHELAWRRSLGSLTVAGVLWLTATVPGFASTWDVGVIESAGDVGRYSALTADPGGDLYVVYARDDVPSVRVATRTGGIWGTPEIVDASSDVAGHCAIFVDAAGMPRVPYRRSGTGSLWYAGPEAAQSWSVDGLTSAHDIGQFVSVLTLPGGDLSAVCRDQTDESLLLLARDGGGTWTVEEVVDAGPDRGAHCDHAYRPGFGYAFSEYDDTGMLLFADAVLRSNAWAGGIAASDGDVGGYLSLARRASGVLSAACRNATDESLILLIRDGTGTWALDSTVDAGPDRGAHADHVYRPGAGYAFSEYDDSGMLMYADPVLRTNLWVEGIVESDGDVGKHLSLARRPSGVLSAACRNVGDESLILLVRDETDGWFLHSTVDAGPERGAHADHVYRPGVGYAFSEYDDDAGALWYADPLLRAQTWDTGVAASNLDVGREVSVVRMPTGDLAAAFYQYDASSLGSIAVAMRPAGGTWGVEVVADSVASSATSRIYPDLVMTETCDWQVSFRKSTDPNPGVYLASVDGLCIIDVEGEEDAPMVPTMYALLGNVPNPFNPTTAFRFELPEAGRVVLEVFDVGGRLVWRHEDVDVRSPGRHRVLWDARDHRGQRLASGVYLYRMTVGSFRDMRRLVLLK